MKLAAIALVTALLFAPPALAGTTNCDFGHDSDADGVGALGDNCDVVYNPTQTDDDFDGFGDMCDADYNNSLFVDGQDFIIFGNNWGSAPGTSCGNALGVPCPSVP